jgi:drug/metabolite transporter (DMT)-like permease
VIGEGLALAAGLCFAAGSLLARKGSDHLPHPVGLGISLASNAAVILLVTVTYMIVTGVPSLSGLGILMFALGGICGTFIARWAAIGSLHRLGPSRAAMYKNLQPVLTTVLAIALLGEPFTAIDLLGGAAVVAGVLTLSYERARANETNAWRIQSGQRRTGILLGLLAALGFAVSNTLRKVGVDLWPEPILGAAIGVSVALLSSTLTGRVTPRTWFAEGWGPGPRYFALFGLANGAAQLLFFTSLLLTPVWIANVFVSMEPILTIGLSLLFFRGNERLGFAPLFSAVLVASGAILIIL